MTVIDAKDVEEGALAVDDLLLFDDLSGTFKQQRFVLRGELEPELRLGSRVLGLGVSLRACKCLEWFVAESFLLCAFQMSTLQC